MVGHARSGTTLTHRLLSQDSGHFSSLMLHEMSPSLLQKKFIRWVAKIDRERGADSRRAGRRMGGVALRTDARTTR